MTVASVSGSPGMCAGATQPEQALLGPAGRCQIPELCRLWRLRGGQPRGPPTPKRHSGMSATTQAKEKAQETAQQAAGEARGRVREQVDQRSTDAGRQVSGTANDARDIAQQLREQGKEGPAKLAEQAADR